MASRVPLNRLRQRIAFKQTRDYRAERDDLHDTPDDWWFLGPSPEDYEEPLEDDYLDWRNEGLDPVVNWLEELLQPKMFAVGERLASADQLRQARVHCVVPSSSVDDETDVPAQDVAALERMVVHWARQLIEDTAQLVHSLDESNGERAALRAIEWESCAVLAALSYPVWGRSISGWTGGTERSLIEHLLMDFPVPPIIDRWFWQALPQFREAHKLDCWNDEFRRRLCMPIVWYLARATGCSVYRVFRALAYEEFAWSKAEISALEHARLESDLSFNMRSLRGYAEVLRLGGNALDWRRLTARTGRRAPWYLRQELHRYQHYPEMYGYYFFTVPLEHYRATVQWLILQREQLQDAEVATILAWSIDELDQGQREDGVPFVWAGRSLSNIRDEAEAYCENERLRHEPQPLRWAGKGWDWTLDEVESNDQWVLRELLTEQALHEEGAAQRHCVAGYVHLCGAGYSAIFQLSHNGLRRLTIQVDPSQRRVVQAKARFNGLPDENAARVVRQWAQTFALNFGELE